ncbi:MAG TPA: hypothetical protein VIQ99_05950 [Gammaproteobacteria bacterium]
MGAALELPVAADLFETEEPLALELAAPFPTVFRQREAVDREWQDATLTYGQGRGAEAGVTVPLRVRVRGRSRAAECHFPPLMLNFRKPDVVGTVFDGQDRLKLVTHCKTTDSYDEYVRLEYLIYRAQALVTQYSLRARPVEAHYVDNGRARDMGTRPAILLEDEERFGERHGMAIFEETRVDRSRYDAEALAVFDVFQYLIGNTDWSVIDGPGEEQCCHNVTPYVRADGKMIPVAYDFDSAGLVNAPHAVPNERLPIRNVRQRLYRGQCRTPEELAPIFARFEQQRSAILALFTPEQGLEEDAAESAREYIEEFYATLADDKQRERAFFNACDD